MFFIKYTNLINITHMYILTWQNKDDAPVCALIILDYSPSGYLN